MNQSAEWFRSFQVFVAVAPQTCRSHERRLTLAGVEENAIIAAILQQTKMHHKIPRKLYERAETWLIGQFRRSCCSQQRKESFFFAATAASSGSAHQPMSLLFFFEVGGVVCVCAPCLMVGFYSAHVSKIPNSFVSVLSL